MKTSSWFYHNEWLYILLITFYVMVITYMSKECSVVINGKEFARKDSLEKAKELDGMPYQIVRTYSAGVFWWN